MASRKSVRKTNNNRKKKDSVVMAGQPQPQPTPAEMEQEAFERAFPDEAAAQKAAQEALDDAPLPQDNDAVSSLELIYGKRGVPGDSPLVSAIHNQNPPLDALGRKIIDAQEQSQRSDVAQFDLLPKHRVTLVREVALEYPEMYLKMFVTGPGSDQKGFPVMFAKSHCFKADNLEEADVVVFTGGPDVNPMLYGEDVHEYTTFNDERDLEEMELYAKCLDRGIPMFGVCRGAQFLHVMNGGKLFQHIDGHHGDHPIFDLKRKKRIERISSVHHQSVMKNDDMDVIAVCSVSQKRWLDAKTYEECKRNDIEAFFYRDTCCVGVQGHPEYRGYDHYTQWCLELIYEYVVLNPDLEWQGKVRRMTPDALKLRDEKWKSIIASHFEKGK
jgi:gamma-glutamyl-gamma-aminobutyrate hydrolase PuuD